MARDSLFGDRILWSGRPARVSLPPLARAVVACASVMAVVSVLFAVVVARAVGAHVDGMLTFGAWSASLALAAWRVPLWWASGVEYLITEQHVIVRRGRFRRSIARDAVSYARIAWGDGDVGDLTLVRAVPTGALRRTLSVTLFGVAAPDRVWATVRGVTAGATLGTGDRDLGQRLDAGERVVWSAMPKSAAWSVRRIASAAVSVVLALAAARVLVHAIPAIGRVMRQGSMSAGLAALLIAGVALGAALLISASIGVGYWSLVRPQSLVNRTRYFVTNRRVLIRRGREELHLDRSRIAYVIAAAHEGTSDVFLVLDGPQARALAPSGAFDERADGDTLLPVLSAIEDADTVSEILRAAPVRDSLPEAA